MRIQITINPDGHPLLFTELSRIKSARARSDRLKELANLALMQQHYLGHTMAHKHPGLLQGVQQEVSEAARGTASQKPEEKPVASVVFDMADLSEVFDR